MGLSWEYFFIITGLFMFSMGIFNFFYLPVSPEEEGIIIP